MKTRAIIIVIAAFLLQGCMTVMKADLESYTALRDHADARFDRLFDEFKAEVTRANDIFTSWAELDEVPREDWEKLTTAYTAASEKWGKVRIAYYVLLGIQKGHLERGGLDIKKLEQHFDKFEESLDSLEQPLENLRAVLEDLSAT